MFTVQVRKNNSLKWENVQDISSMEEYPKVFSSLDHKMVSDIRIIQKESDSDEEKGDKT